MMHCSTFKQVVAATRSPKDIIVNMPVATVAACGHGAKSSQATERARAKKMKSLGSSRKGAEGHAVGRRCHCIS